MLIIGAIVVGLVVLIVIFLFIAEKGMVYGNCPQCKTRIGLNNGIGACEKCGEGLRFLNGEFIPLEAGLIPDNPTFSVRLSQLKCPSKWSPIWQGQCCVCRQPAARQKRIKIKRVEGHMGPLLAPMNIMETTKFEVGYCASHKNGARFSSPPGFAKAITNDECFLVIRSFDYYREFMQKNSLSKGSEEHTPNEDAAVAEVEATRIPCSECGAMILPATAERTGGICMMCKLGKKRSAR